ncbi:MAG TPA: hypothetical protein VFI65_22175 [Streptosporangiaceae bacterium]|nr:hypothetical protein [Streptosporangiaceae bacterium]
MAKSNRQRKLDRAKRQARDSQKQSAARRRQEWQQEVEARAGRMKVLSNPDSPLAEIANVLNTTHEGGPISAYVVGQMKDFGWSMERLTQLADAMLVPKKTSGADEAGESEPALTDLTFAAQVNRAIGNSARAGELLDQAFAVSDTSGDTYNRLRLIDNLRGIGRLAEATTLLEASLRDDPDDGYAMELYGIAINQAYEQANGQQSMDSCACGSGAAWAECCGPRERAALDRFTDRSGLTDLTEAVSAFLSGSEYGRAVDKEVARHLKAVEALKFKPDELDSFRALVAENALLTARPEPQDEPEGQDSEAQDSQAQDSQPLTAIEAFAAAPSTPPELAARAQAWREHFHYGLWKLESEPEPPPPGSWCTDISTGELRYVNFPAQFTDGWPRWSVWLGGIVPVDGIWRATGTGLRLSPAEADAAAEFVDKAVINVVNSLAGKKKTSLRPDDPMRVGSAEPYGVLIEHQDPMPPLTASVTLMAIAQLIWRIFLEVHLDRETKHLRGRSPLGEGQEKSWIDEPLATLRGRTPRQSAEGKDEPRVESMLRQFEYEADELAAQGKSGLDTDWLREELDLPVLSLDD